MEINIESFKATLQFARMVLWMVFVACLYRGVDSGVIWVIACAAFSYAAQFCYTHAGTLSEETHPGVNKKLGLVGVALHIIVLVAFIAAFGCLASTPSV